MDRRKFIKKGSLVSFGFIGLRSLVRSCGIGETTGWTGLESSEILARGYGPLKRDRKGILNLPKNFTYKIISRHGNRMADGFIVPGLADGMATFPLSSEKIAIIRNHEVSPNDLKNGPFGSKNRLFESLSPHKLYDAGRGNYPCLGGTTTIIYNTRKQKIEKEYLSLAGTIRNCAGGPTPWNSWISCEENTNRADRFLEKDHGYNFEVPVSEKVQIFAPEPLKAMGRFNHEAVCVEPRSGIVYQTEDRPDGLIYRYLPNTYGKLNDGGKLQIMAIKGEKGFDTRNWPNTKGGEMKINLKYQVEWLDIDGTDAPNDDLRYRGVEKGAAVFARGEGMWFGDNEVYFACTNGGRELHGQIFRYTPSKDEGNPQEQKEPGTLEIFIEPNNAELVESCDNVTTASNGDLIICEDKIIPRIVGVTPNGKIYHIAKNVGYNSEFAGAAFSPDGRTLFVNIQGPGLTLAIDGPWNERAEG